MEISILKNGVKILYTNGNQFKKLIMNIYYSKYKYAYNLLDFTRRKTESGDNYGDGHYRHYDGWCVRIYADDGFKRRFANTTLDMSYKGVTYNKTYECCFSDHGLKMICNAFIKEVISGKLKNVKNGI